MSIKFFTNCNVVDVVNEKVFGGSVLVDGSTIKEVGEKLTCPARGSRWSTWAANG